MNRTSFNGTIKLRELTLSCSSLEIFLVAGFSRTIFKEEELLLLLLMPDEDGGVVKDEVENPETHPITSAADDKNFIFFLLLLLFLYNFNDGHGCLAVISDVVV